MIPFENTWPYETIGEDVYVTACPYCGRDNVLLPVRKKDLKPIREGRKKLLIFPCCHGRMTVVDADADYLLANARVRRK